MIIWRDSIPSLREEGFPFPPPVFLDFTTGLILRERVRKAL